MRLGVSLLLVICAYHCGFGTDCKSCGDGYWAREFILPSMSDVRGTCVQIEVRALCAFEACAYICFCVEFNEE